MDPMGRQLQPTMGIEDTVPNLARRESLGAKRRRARIFPVLRKLVFNIALYEKMCIGPASVSQDQYIVLVEARTFPSNMVYKAQVRGH